MGKEPSKKKDRKSYIRPLLIHMGTMLGLAQRASGSNFLN